MSNSSYSVTINAALANTNNASASSALNAGTDYGSAASQTTYTTYTTATTSSTSNIIYGQQVGGGWQWQQTGGSTIWPYNPSTTQPIITITPGTISIPSVWPAPPKWPEDIPDTIGLLYIKDGKLMMRTDDGSEIELVDLSTADGETAQILIAVAAKKNLSEGVSAK